MDHREIFIRGTLVFFFFLITGKGLQEIFRNYNLYYNRSKYELYGFNHLFLQRDFNMFL